MCQGRARHQPVTCIKWPGPENAGPGATQCLPNQHLSNQRGSPSLPTPKAAQQGSRCSACPMSSAPAEQCAPGSKTSQGLASLKAAHQATFSCLHSLLCLPVGFLGGITVASVVGMGGLAHFTWHRQLLAVSGLVGRGLLAKITTCLLILGEASLPIYLMAQHSLRVLQRSIFQDVMQGAKTWVGVVGAEVRLTPSLLGQHSPPPQARPIRSMMTSTVPFRQDRLRSSSSPSDTSVCPTAAQPSHSQELLTVTNAAAGA